jgi:hypothetical protein
MPSTNPTTALGAQTPSQSAYQPPTYLYQLYAQGISLYGTPLTPAERDVNLTWQKEMLKHWEGKSVAQGNQSNALTAAQVTNLRAKVPWGGMRKKRDRVKEPETYPALM